MQDVQLLTAILCFAGGHVFRDGWPGTGSTQTARIVGALICGIGAAVAAAKAMGLNETGIATALGHAANQAGGLRESHTTMGSQFTPGHTARCGLMSALLAARGFTCSDTMIEGEKGFGVSFAANPNMDVAVENLGKAFEISTLAYKQIGRAHV